MLLQTSDVDVFRGGQVIGATDNDDSVGQLRPKALDPNTLQPEETGSYLNPEALHVWLRHRAQLWSTEASEHLFPLRAGLWGGLESIL